MEEKVMDDFILMYSCTYFYETKIVPCQISTHR